MMNYIYQFEKHPAAKGTCPECGEKNTFRYYHDQSRDYGKCERANSCGFFNPPKGEASFIVKNPVLPKTDMKIVYPDRNQCKDIVKSHSSTFHIACKSLLNIPIDHFEKWNVGSKDTKTAYILKDVSGKEVNIKFIQYDQSCKRNKEMPPFYLSSKSNDEKYSTCLFGEHLLTDKHICLVESEKTAFIASFHYPNFDWLATGSRNGLTDEKTKVLENKKVFYLPDADSAGRENSTINKLEFHKINFRVIDLFPERNDGCDLADSIFNNYFPNLINKIEHRSETLTPKNYLDQISELNSEKKTKHIQESKLTRIEKFINLNYELRYNTVSNEIETKSRFTNEPFEPANVNNIFRLLESNFIPVSISILEVLLRSDFVPRFDPFADYFENLAPWDNESDIDYIGEMSKYIKVKESEIDRFKIQLKKHLVRCVACALNDRYFNKHCLVFVFDQQSSGKSTLCRWFCPPLLDDYIIEALSNDKDSLISLSDNFIINLDEMATMNKSDIQSLKSMFSKDRIKARPPFGKKSVMFPRRASFFGSTDRAEFLTDDAGTVRWVCFQLEKIDWDYDKKIQINNIWRQAYSLYKGGKYKYDLTKSELNENENSNKGFKVNSTEMELVNKYFDPGTKEIHDHFYTSTDLQQDLAIKAAAFKLNTVNIGRALKALGFVQDQKRKGTSGFPFKGYYINFRKEDNTPTT